MKEKNQKYLFAFKKLRVDRSHGIAPHKPILLLSILQAVKAKIITTNKVFISPELIALFKTNWSHFVTTNHYCKLALPFFHLRNEKFWHLIAKQGNEGLLLLASSISSINQLDSLIEYALIDQELFDLMRNESDNNIFQQFLLEEYFPNSNKKHLEIVSGYNMLIEEVENKILHESAEDYKKEIEGLLAQKDEEEIFFRGSLFKKEIPKIYNNSCCISGLRIDSKLNVSMIDACHIRPFSESYDDTINNGISLCPNLHRAFDRGIITINSDYKVIVSDSFSENNNSYGIKQFQNKTITLPKKEEHWPLTSNFEWHRSNVFKA